MSNYTITAQRQTTIIDNGGQLVGVMEVKFRTPAGVVGMVDVPLKEYTVDKVRQLVEERVSTIEAVHALGAGS